MNVFHGARVQKGYGLGNILGGLFRKALPYLWQGAKYAGKTALRTGIDVANDVIDGQDVKSSLKTRTNQLGRDLGGKVAEELTKQMRGQIGRGRKTSLKKVPTNQIVTSP